MVSVRAYAVTVTVVVADKVPRLGSQDARMLNF